MLASGKVAHTVNSARVPAAWPQQWHDIEENDKNIASLLLFIQNVKCLDISPVSESDLYVCYIQIK